MNPAAPPASHGRYHRFADFYSLAGDWVLFRDLLFGRKKF